jgi:membrane-associated HD superfamily phosphohydrolase
LQLRRADVLLRVALCVFAAVLMWSVTRAWAPPIVYRTGDVPPTDIVAREPAPHLALGDLDDEAAATLARHRLLLARAGRRAPETVAALRLDHLQMVVGLPSSRKWTRSLVVFGVIFGMFGLCGYYIYYRDRRLVRDLRRFCTLLVLVVVTAATASWFWDDPWRAEIIPILVFGMTCGIAYSRELALLLSASLLIFLGLTSGYSLGHFVVLFSSVVTAILLLDQIRSRSKLIKVGFFTGLEVFLLTVGVDILESHTLDRSLLAIAAWNGVWAFLAGFLITGLLPFIESIFGVLTEISLLELGDASHPLLQELVRRAPGTYNHSINVASCEAASIGAKRLWSASALFHDIGKMLKPGYCRNQGSG